MAARPGQGPRYPGPDRLRLAGLTGYRRGRGSLLPVGRSSHEAPRDT